MDNKDAVTAAKRFGLGPKPGDLKRIAGDPRGYVLASLSKPDAALIGLPGLHPSQVVFAEALAAQRKQKFEREMMRQATEAVDAGESKPGGPSPAEQPPKAEPMPAPQSAAATEKAGQIRREAFVEEAAARFRHAARPTPPSSSGS